VQHFFAALDEKRVILSGTVQDLPVVIDMHVPTRPVWLSKHLPILCLFYSLCIALQPHTTSQS